MSGSRISLAAGLERSQGAGFIRLHEAAVADHIGGQNGGKAALGTFFGHRVQLPPENATRNCMAAPLRSLSGRRTALGQFRTWVNGGPMSGVTSKADPISPSPDVSISAISRSVSDLSR